MRPSSLFHLYRVRLRARLPQDLLALAGIAVGVALTFTMLIASTSLSGSVRELARGMVSNARLQLAARGPDGLDARLVRVVRRTDGVAAVTPAVEVPANVIGPRGRRSVLLIGGDPHTSIGGSLVHRFMAVQLFDRGPLALPAPVAEALGVSPGDNVRLQVGRRTVPARLGTELQRSEIGTIVDDPVAVAPIAFAQRVSGMRDRVSRMFVRPEPGRDRDVKAALLKLAAGSANVRRADHNVALFEQAAYLLIRSTAMFSVFFALVGFLFAFGAVLLTVPQRRRFVADLRTAGHAPWVIIELLLFDALVLGVAGSLLGLLAGDQVSRHLFGADPGFLVYAFPLGAQHVVTWQSVAVAGGAGIVAACVAVLAPMWSALRDRATAAGERAGDGPERRAAALGLGVLAVATVIAYAVPRAVAAGPITLTCSLLLLLPLLLRSSTRAFEALTRAMRTPVPMLAALELRSRSARTRAFAVASTGAVAVYAAVGIAGAQADLQRGLGATNNEIDGNADVWATFPGSTNGAATAPFPVPSTAIAALRGLAGVESVGVYRGSFLDIADHRVWVQAPPRSAPAPIPPSQVRHGDLALATRRLRDGGWTVLSRAVADELGTGLGDRVRLPSPVPTQLRVAAITTNLGWPPGAILLNADDYARAWGSSVPSALQIRLAAHASPTHIAAAARQVLGPVLPVQVETLRQRNGRRDAASRQSLNRLGQLTLVVLIAAVLAVAAAMGGMIWQRRPALAALKVHGYPEGELWRALLLESALLLGVGALVGAVFGLYAQILMGRGLAAIIDFPVIYSPAGLVALEVLVLVTVVVVAMVALPGWLAVRVRPTTGGPA